MTDLYIVQDSALNQKDMIFDVEKYIRASNTDYNFYHNPNFLFNLYHEEDTNSFVVGHRIFDVADINKPEAQEFYARIDISKVKQYADQYGNCYVMTDLPGYVNDKDLLRGMKYYSRTDDTHFVDCETGLRVTRTDDISRYFFSFMYVYRFNTLPIYATIINSTCVMSEFRHATINDTTNDNMIMSSQSSEYIKDKVMAANFGGIDDIIGKETVFVNSDTVTIDIFTDTIKSIIATSGISADDLKQLISVKSSVPFTTDGYVLTVDTSGLSSGQTAYFRFTLHVHDFFERFIFESQRPYFEYNLYRM